MYNTKEYFIFSLKKCISHVNAQQIFFVTFQSSKTLTKKVVTVKYFVI